MTDFALLPGDERMRWRRVLADEIGAEVVCYAGPAVVVHLPYPLLFGELEAMAGAGLRLVPGSLNYFPLGTDNPPERMRHDGRYPGCKGFWLCAAFEVAA